jgi:signal transduction histidine kinase
MNLFGNALKYTETGYISVSLRVNEGSIAAGVPETVALTITDSGQGMSADFLANKAFQAFSQENPVCASRVRIRLVQRLTRSSECSTPRGRD